MTAPMQSLTAPRDWDPPMDEGNFPLQVPLSLPGTRRDVFAARSASGIFAIGARAPNGRMPTSFTTFNADEASRAITFLVNELRESPVNRERVDAFLTSWPVHAELSAERESSEEPRVRLAMNGRGGIALASHSEGKITDIVMLDQDEVEQLRRALDRQAVVLERIRPRGVE